MTENDIHLNGWTGGRMTLLARPLAGLLALILSSCPLFMR